MRVVLVSPRAGQALPERAANGLVTVYSVGGRVLFYEGTKCCDMVPGTLIRLAPGEGGLAPAGHHDQAERHFGLERPGSQRSDAGSAADPTRTSPQHRVLRLRQPYSRRVVSLRQRSRSATPARADGTTPPWRTGLGIRGSGSLRIPHQSLADCIVVSAVAGDGPGQFSPLTCERLRRPASARRSPVVIVRY